MTCEFQKTSLFNTRLGSLKKKKEKVSKEGGKGGEVKGEGKKSRSLLKSPPRCHERRKKKKKKAKKRKNKEEKSLHLSPPVLITI